MKIKYWLMVAVLVIAGCGTVSTSFIESKPDPENPIDKSAKIWVSVPSGETLDERLVRYKVESVMKGLGYNLVHDLADSEYILGITIQDSHRNVTSVNTTANVVAIPSGGSAVAVVQTQQTPSTRTMSARDIYFAVARTSDYLRYLETKEDMPSLWEGRAGLSLAAFDTYGEKAIRELFMKFPNSTSGYFTLGPRVW